jgi:hypothetical protein
MSAVIWAFRPGKGVYFIQGKMCLNINKVKKQENEKTDFYINGFEFATASAASCC